MLSFFTKHKKHSPEDEPIQGPEQQNNNADDFIFIEKKPSQPNPPENGALYPPMPHPGVPYPPAPGGPSASSSGTSSAPLPYVHGVPFQMAPELCPTTTHDFTQSQVDGILAAMTRQMSVDAAQDYNFMLERSIQNNSY